MFNKPSSTGVSSTGTCTYPMGGLTLAPMPPSSLTISRAENGWIIECSGRIYVAKTWNDAVEKMKELLQVK